MPRFSIIQTDNPLQYKSDIVRLWKENLPDTGDGRLQWMKEGNPAGPAIWFLAFDAAKDELAGTISVMPRMMVYKGKSIRAGIMGDLMVDRKFRVLGPAVMLPKAVVNNLSNQGIEFLYTMPNKASVKILERNKFKCITKYNSFVRPINLFSYLDKYLNLSSKGGRVFAAFEKFIRSYLRVPFEETEGIFREETKIDDSFDVLWNEFKKNTSYMLMTERESRYLKWRYLNNPQFDFKILTYKSSLGGPLSGYLIYTSNRDKIQIFDILSLSSDVTKKLLKKLIRIAKASHCSAIYVTINQRMPLSGLLRRYFFFNNDYITLYAPENSKIQHGNWYFLPGDRNL